MPRDPYSLLRIPDTPLSAPPQGEGSIVRPWQNKQTNKSLGLFKWTKVGDHSFFTLNLVYAGECWYGNRDWHSAYIFGVRWLKWHVAFFISILENWLLNQPVTIADFTGKTWTSVILCAGEGLITYFGNFILNARRTAMLHLLSSSAAKTCLRHGL